MSLGWYPWDGISDLTCKPSLSASPFANFGWELPLTKSCVINSGPLSSPSPSPSWRSTWRGPCWPSLACLGKFSAPTPLSTSQPLEVASSSHLDIDILILLFIVITIFILLFIFIFLFILCSSWFWFWLINQSVVILSTWFSHSTVGVLSSFSVKSAPVAPSPGDDIWF